MAYIVTLPLTRAWLVDPLNPSIGAIACGTRQSSQDTANLDGEFRTFAGNRVQLVNRTLDTYVRPITFAALTATQAAQLMLSVGDGGWRGKLLCLRTIEGDRIFGAYLQAQKSRHYHASVDSGVTTTAFDVTVQFTRVTYNESV